MEVNVNEDLPKNHFTQVDIDQEWNRFLEGLRNENSIIYHAISGFRIIKEGEDNITVYYSTEAAKSEFDAVHADFFNGLRTKVKNYGFAVNFQRDQTIRRELITKQKVFDKMVEKNPLIGKLNEIFKFDLS